MAYDYRLGRRNAYDFLARHFIFPEHNPIFVGPHWTDRQRQEQRVIDANGVRHLRMIPLMPQLQAPPMPTASRLAAPDHDAGGPGCRHRGAAAISPSSR